MTHSDASLSYRADAARDITAIGRVVLLYEQLVKDLQRAMAAVGRNDIEERTSEINHALLVVGQLQACLDMEGGGEVARNLDRFYGQLRASLLHAQMSGSKEILSKQVSSVLLLREAWIQSEQLQTESASAGMGPRGSPPLVTGTGQQEWKA